MATRVTPEQRQRAIDFIQSSAGVQAAQNKGMTWSIGQTFSNAWLSYNWLSSSSSWLKANVWNNNYWMTTYTPSTASNIPWSYNKGSSLNLYNQTNWGTKKTYNPDWSPIEEDNKQTQQDIFWDVMYWDKSPNRTPYTGEWFATTQGKYKTWVKISIPKENNVYWEAAKIAEQAAKWTISKRNDYIVSNLFAEWAKTKDDIRNFLNAQQWFMWANSVDKQNTVEAIAARMWITKESITPQDMIAQQQNDLLKNYQDEQWQLILDADQQKAWKEFDAIGWTDPSRYPTESEIQNIANKYQLDPKKAQEAADAWKIAKDKSIEQQRWKEKDIWTEKDRNIEDAQTQIQRNKEDINNQIDDVVTQLGRDVSWAEKVWALKWYNLSSGYVEWINNIKTDANKVLDKLHTALSRAESDTSKYITRISDDYTTNMSRLKTSMTDQLMNNKMAWTAEVQALLTKYAPTDVLLTKELKRVNDEFGIKSQALMKSFLENFKGITDAAMYESEKLQEYTYKQAQLADLTISNLMANNWMALLNMSDSAIQDLYKAWYIRQSDVSMLKSAREWAKQLLAQSNKVQNQWLDLDWAQLKLQQDKLNKELWITDVEWIKKNMVAAVNSIPNWIKTWQCVEFVNDALESAWLGSFSHDKDQSLANKLSKKNSSVPKVWSVLIRTSKSEPKYWDVVMVTAVNWNTISYKWSNRNWDELSYTGTIQWDDPSILWYYDPKIAASTSQDWLNELDATSQSILKQTWLDISEFNYLTQWQTALTRMPIEQQNKVKAKTTEFLNKNWLDYSTFRSRYTALNKSLERTTNIMSNVQRDEIEIQWTLENLISSADSAKFGKMKRANLLKMFAWEEFNDPNIIEYQFQLMQLREEVAWYNAALRWDTSPVENDSKIAEAVIANWISSWWLEWLQKAMDNSVLKLWKNLPKQIGAINKQVWDLFWVWSNYWLWEVDTSPVDNTTWNNNVWSDFIPWWLWNPNWWTNTTNNTTGGRWNGN